MDQYRHCVDSNRLLILGSLIGVILTDCLYRDILIDYWYLAYEVTAGLNMVTIERWIMRWLLWWVT